MHGMAAAGETILDLANPANCVSRRWPLKFQFSVIKAIRSDAASMTESACRSGEAAASAALGAGTEVLTVPISF